jgi:hypothetical protein
MSTEGPSGPRELPVPRVATDCSVRATCARSAPTAGWEPAAEEGARSFKPRPGAPPPSASRSTVTAKPPAAGTRAIVRLPRAGGSPPLPSPKPASAPA